MIDLDHPYPDDSHLDHLDTCACGGVFDPGISTCPDRCDTCAAWNARRYIHQIAHALDTLADHKACLRLGETEELWGDITRMHPELKEKE